MSLYSKAHPRVCDNCTEVLRLLPARQKPFRDVKSVLFVQTTPQWCTKPRSSGTRRRDLDPPRQVLVKGSLARGPRRRHRPQFPPALAGFTTAGPPASRSKPSHLFLPNLSPKADCLQQQPSLKPFTANLGKMSTGTASTLPPPTRSSDCHSMQVAFRQGHPQPPSRRVQCLSPRLI